MTNERLNNRLCCLRAGFVFGLAALFFLQTTLSSQAQPSGAQQRAAQLLQQGNYDQAIAGYREVLASDSNNYDAHLGVATAQFHKGAFAEAQAGFLLCTRLQPQRVEAYLWQGQTAEAQKQLDQALSAYQAALVIQPQNERALQAVARLRRGGSGTNSFVGLLGDPPFGDWRFYCLAFGVAGALYPVFRRKIPPSNAAKRELAESFIGAVGAMAGDSAGDNMLSRAGRWHAQRHMLESISAFKIQSRALLALAALVGAGIAWVCFREIVSVACPDAVWFGAGLAGCFFLWKFRWTFT